MVEHAGDRDTAFDFMGEADTSPIDRVTRRYPMVAILKLAETCPQICVYCQRNWEIRPPRAEAVASTASIERALAWFARHPTVVDVLVTGGDPLIVPLEHLASTLERLAALPHILHLRIGSRVPVTMPMGVTEEIAALLGRSISPGRRCVSLVTHVESPLEITPEFVGAVGRLRRHGIGVYNQLVYTVETSRRFQAVATRLALKTAGVDPYYVFYAKGKDEHRSYLVPIARVLQERKEEARLLPGPFRTDEPVFNVPRLGKTHLRADGDRELIGIRGDGRRVYLFHPWEKGIAPTAPWIYVDVSIDRYLRTLEQLGEEIGDYRSVWYYY
jgi:lysine 2,3-aminomutase